MNKIIRKLKEKYVKLKIFISNSYILRGVLSEAHISNADDFLLDMNLAILENSYEVLDGLISKDALEDLWIAKRLMKEAKFNYQDSNSTKENKITVNKQAFEGIGKNLHKWWD